MLRCASWFCISLVLSLLTSKWRGESVAFRCNSYRNDVKQSTVRVSWCICRVGFVLLRFLVYLGVVHAFCVKTVMGGCFFSFVCVAYFQSCLGAVQLGFRVGCTYAMLLRGVLSLILNSRASLLQQSSSI